MDELLPCPFCGEKPEQSDRASNDTATGHVYFIACMCGEYSACAHKMGDTEASVIAAWNTRSQPVAQGEPDGFAAQVLRDGIGRWYIQPNMDWEVLGEGSKLYAAPVMQAQGVPDVNKELLDALHMLAETDLNDSNCASLEVASQRIRSFARGTIDKVLAAAPKQEKPPRLDDTFAKDAARYRWLRNALHGESKKSIVVGTLHIGPLRRDDLDDAIDAAMAPKQEGK